VPSVMVTLGTGVLLILFLVNSQETEYAVPFRIIEEKNVLLGFDDQDLSVEIEDDQDDRLHLLQEFFIFTSEDYRARKLEGVPLEDIEKRQEEFNKVLQRNLNHPFTSTLTIVHNDTNLRTYLDNLELRNNQKLKLIHIYDEPTVMIIHQDNVLGEGVERINIKRFKKENIAYALTRTVEEGSCQGGNTTLNHTTGPYCKKGGEYGWSHDAFVFSIKHELPTEMFNILNFKADQMGQESRLIWFFQHVLKYRVLNPCFVINVYHQHCSYVRTRSGGRVAEVTEGYVQFSDLLF